MITDRPAPAVLAERTVGGLHEHLLLKLRELPTGRGSLLDIGCGTGAWLAQMRDSNLGFGRLVGIDQDPPPPMEAIEFHRVDLNRNTFDTSQKFDVVTCIEVIEHVENIGLLLDLIRNVLAKNGLAFITTPNVESLRARTRHWLSGRMPSFDEKSDLTHLCPILRDSLDKMLRRRGLQLQRTLQYPEDVNHSLMFRAGLRRLSAVLRLALPDRLFGDNVIHLVRHAA